MKTMLPSGSDMDPKNLPLTTNPVELSEYTQRVQWASKHRLGRISRALENTLDASDAIMISTTGSDGRHENKIFDSDASNTELSILHRTGQDLIQFWNQKESQEDTVESVVKRIQETTSFIIAHVELKNIGKDAMALYNNDPHLIFPTRVWDSYRLWGNQGMDSMIREIVSQEIINNPKMASRFYDRLRQHVRVNKTGNYRIGWATNTQFNVESNEFYYDPKNHIEGVKMWPLRVIQYSLALALMRKIRNLGKHPDFVNTLPGNIPDRLDFLLKNDLTAMSREQVEELQYIYRFFLKMYHQMQYENFTAGTTVFSVDRDTLTDIKAMLSLLNDTFTDRLFK